MFSAFQRVLACQTDRDARNLSVGAGLICLACAIPPLLLGAVARSLDWAALAGPEVADELVSQPALVLPYLLRYAVPPGVAMIGLGAVAAAVMSSVDSSILSAAAIIGVGFFNQDEEITDYMAYAMEVGRELLPVALFYDQRSQSWYHGSRDTNKWTRIGGFPSDFEISSLAPSCEAIAIANSREMTQYGHDAIEEAIGVIGRLARQ